MQQCLTFVSRQDYTFVVKGNDTGFAYDQILTVAEKDLSYLGFSRGSGSLRPSPTGFLSASSAVKRCNSASTFPWLGLTTKQTSQQVSTFWQQQRPKDQLFLYWPTVSSNSSSSFLATKGHQPLILFCLKMETMGISASLVTISMVHCLAVLAPRGKRLRSSSIAPLGERQKYD